MKDMSRDTTITIGSFEYVDLPGLKMDNIVAKIDTGAYSGAINCTDIKEVRRKTDGIKVLRFKPSNQHDNVSEFEDFKTVKVRSSSGHQIKRYLIETDIIIKQKQYTIRIGLTDRSDMQREVLIGRRFLRQHNMLVDVRINQELDNDGGVKI
jgi:hypothetical protein